ncbi:MAG: ABC transporter permease [Candidatus Dadabacteria bacterium]|nr:ABC transporter permease [Candidatus Dadabacteria bacterium]
MNFTSLLKNSFRQLIKNKLRSTLTSIGIIIGVAAVILSVSITNSAKILVETQFLSLGGKSLIVNKGTRTKSGKVKKDFKIDFNINDVNAIKKLQIIEHASPVSDVAEYVKYKDTSHLSAIVGVSVDFFYVNNWLPVEGSLFTDKDVSGSENVCLIGRTVSNRLFGYINPIGKKIKILNTNYEVLGVLSTIGQTSSGRDQDDAVIIPYSSYHKKIIGSNEIENISASVTNPRDIAIAEQQVTRLLRERYNVNKNQVNGFHIKTQLFVIDRIMTVSRIMTILLGSIASISLIVGGIGIMNIMLVSVIERTKEIGIRMAVGAKQKDIMIHFVIEALMLSIFGGSAGILLGIGMLKIASTLTNMQTFVSTSAILIAFLFSAVVGVFFGYYPARKASRLNPIEALRYE